MVGATGQIGRAAVQALAADGWEVLAASRGGGRDERWPDDVRTVAVDREDGAALAGALGDGCDVLLDCVAYGPEHAGQLLGMTDRIGSAVVISSAGVYEDDQGRSFDTQDEPDGFPLLPVPVTESQPTVTPGEATYATRKAALEQALLAGGMPVTLLRAGAVHGPHCRAPRELYFVKRALDGRRVRVLAHDGAGMFHHAHVANIAELVRLAARKPGSRILNAGDPEVLSVREIADAIGAVLDWECETVVIDGPPPAPGVGNTPWSVDRPVVLDMSAAERELGYRAVTGYAASLPGTVSWLAAQLDGRDWREAFPEMAALYRPEFLFAYAAEDAWLAGRSSMRPGSPA